MVFGLQIRRRFKLNHLRESECIKITPFDRVNIKIINYILEDASRQSNQGQESRNNQYFNHRIFAPLWNHLLLHSRNPSSNRSKTHRYTQSQIHPKPPAKTSLEYTYPLNQEPTMKFQTLLTYAIAILVVEAQFLYPCHRKQKQCEDDVECHDVCVFKPNLPGGYLQPWCCKS